ncbi:MAG: hypothetical protein ACREMY_15590 [bacterium]
MISLLLAVALAGPVPTARLDLRSEAIGKAFCSAAVAGKALHGPKAIPDVVNIGDSLGARMVVLQPTLRVDCRVRVRRGDAPPPLGDGRGTHTVLIRSGDRDRLALRLHYDVKADRFDIVGFWTP